MCCSLSNGVNCLPDIVINLKHNLELVTPKLERITRTRFHLAYKTNIPRRWDAMERRDNLRHTLQDMTIATIYNGDYVTRRVCRRGGQTCWAAYDNCRKFEKDVNQMMQKSGNMFSMSRIFYWFWSVVIIAYSTRNNWVSFFFFPSSSILKKVLETKLTSVLKRKGEKPGDWFFLAGPTE